MNLGQAVARSKTTKGEVLYRNRLLDELYNKLGLFDYKWLISKLDSQKMSEIKKEFRLDCLAMTLDEFIQTILKVFNDANPIANLCLALGAQSFYKALQAQEQTDFTYKTLVDFIYIVIEICANSRMKSARVETTR